MHGEHPVGMNYYSVAVAAAAAVVVVGASDDRCGLASVRRE